MLAKVQPAAKVIVILALTAGIGSGCQRERPEHELGGPFMKIELTSSAFQDGQTIPRKYTGDGQDISPPLSWGKLPDQARGLALICDDPDAPRKTWVHWVIFNLPPEPRELSEAVPARETLSNGARQGKNDFGKIGYGGPAPPPGKPHRYYFKLYVLDQTLNLAAGATKDELLAAMKGHVVAEGQLMGKYGRE